MSLSKKGYPSGPLVRAVWDCCYELFVSTGSVPTRQEPARVGISTHAIQWSEGKQHHEFKRDVTTYENFIPSDYLSPQRWVVVYAVRVLGEVSIPQVIEWITVD